MNKLDYLGQLENILKKNHLPKEDVDDIIRDYAEFFEEGRRQGQSDGEISAKLGSPELVADQIMEENGHKVAIAPIPSKKEFKMPEFKFPKWERKEKETKAKKERHGESIFSVMVKTLLLIFILPVLVCVFGAALMFLGGCLLALFGAAIAIIAGFICAALVAHFLPLSVSILAICLCICLLALVICVGALMLMLMGWCFKSFMSMIHALFGTKEKSAAPAAAHSEFAEEEEFNIDEEAQQYE